MQILNRKSVTTGLSDSTDAIPNWGMSALPHVNYKIKQAVEQAMLQYTLESPPGRPENKQSKQSNHSWKIAFAKALPFGPFRIRVRFPHPGLGFPHAIGFRISALGNISIDMQVTRFAM